ncbi:right-handed parallel beta-helix repeat-containing protein [Budviciaceae bacterium BWR-B9]|uniref:Right-handed parallel beta-helix repeat-containing protein n=1 Tax=Limnobaculum allomyrinae TaxID=2791986 RepID=A0ABS1IUI5_9GAMM|nr:MULTISPECIES: right-handed parallel beta-helix repeat-containing protein [Limnobaculum]MBK5145416.1 right-handed parallel beta-helix repeat-containing protein [Limnobaculum allomyrinae]MBV7693156.1 right-handed parallel beta-helix repeat-containing protein [Limnobaculum sp. M2-1]
MATTPTQVAVPSELPQDLKFNSGKIDEFVTSMGWSYIDRFGNKHYTIEGLRYLAQQAIAAFGYITMDSFQDGAELTLPNQVLRDTTTGEYYRWDGALPKVVPAGSTPQSSGGVGIGSWMSIGDAALRSDLASADVARGSSLVEYTPSFPNGVSNSVSEKLTLDVRTLTDYGFKAGNTGAQNKAAFQAAIDSATLPIKIVIPEGSFLVEPGITIKTNVAMIVGSGPYQSRLFPSSGGTAVITQQVGDITFCELRDFGIDGNGNCPGINLSSANHIKIYNVDVSNTTNNAILLNGYSNDVIGCRIFSNKGNGLSLGGVLNNINILRNRIYGNEASGILVNPTDPLAGLSVNIMQNDIEQNKLSGIYAFNCKGLNIDFNYFERNGESGYPYGIPEAINIKADIHLIASEYTLIGSLSLANKCVSVRGNQQTAIGFASSMPNQDGFIFTNFAHNLKVENNQILDASKINALISIYRNNLSSKIDTLLTISSNTINDVNFIGSYDAANQNPNGAHFIYDIDNKMNVNHADRNMLSWVASAGSTGSLTKSTNLFNGEYSFIVGDGDRTWFSSIDLSVHQELKGKWVWFGAWVNDQGNSSKIRLGIDGQFGSDGSVTGTAKNKWEFISVCTFIPTSKTTIGLNVNKVGSGIVLINSPCAVSVGTAFNRVSSPPTQFRSPSLPSTGFWDKGERVINSAPATGQPKAWTCTVGGGPGVVNWLSEGNF